MIRPERTLVAPLLRHPAGWRLLLLLTLALAWDAAGADLQVMRLLGDAHGFALKNNPLLVTGLHDMGKQLAVLLALVMAVLVWKPLGPWALLHRGQRAAALAAVLSGMLAVSLLKHYSLTSCPWELDLFGGMAHYISHWQWGLQDGGGGHCFPGGHASAALGFMPASLPFLLSPHSRLQKTGQWLFVAALAVGLLFGVVQTLRGAHYPSHTLWAAVICWAVGYGVYRVGQRRLAP